MTRLVDPPVGIGRISIDPLSGPRTVGKAGTQAIGGFAQTTAAAFGLWRFRFGFHVMREDAYRRYRGWLTAMHGGAVPTRWRFADPDRMRPAQAGLLQDPDTRWDNIGGPDWANGQAWSNGMPWASEAPDVPVFAAAARGASEVRLADSFWGHGLDVGDQIGFAPFHFGLYTVTRVLDEGRYQIWPPLRKAIGTSDFATLDPVLVMRLEDEDSGTAGRGLVVADSLSVTMVEVLDYDVRDFFAE